MIRVYLFVILFSVLGAIGYGAYKYYVTTQETIQQLTENNAQLEVAVKTSEESIQQMERAVELQAQLASELSKKLQESEAYKDSLIGKLQKHDLARLSLKKPGLIENRINEATKKVFDEIESDTALDTAGN
jgi:Tfp pilus assembly protein PilE